MSTSEHTPAPEDGAGPPPGARAMAAVRWLLVLVMAVLAVTAVGHRAGWFERAGGAEVSTVYYCPMHPSVVQDHPGECPICSMSLVPKPAGKPSAQPAPAATTAPVPGLAPVQLTPDRVQLTGLRTATVKHERLSPRLRATGTIAANEKGLAVIQVRFAGWIERLSVEQTGQRVGKGQVLATIYGPDVLAAQQEYLNALRWSASVPARGALPAVPGNLKEDARRRLELLGISNSEIDEIERSGQPLRAVPIRSPVAGFITQKNAIQGLYVQPGTALFEVANLSTVWALADVNEHDLARVRVGQQATMELASFPGEAFAGKVSFIHPALDPTTRTLRVRVEFANKDLRLKPGMFGTVEIELDGAEGLVVPREALVDTGTMQYVFVAGAKGMFEPRRVTAGGGTADKVQILTGLAEGEVVVTTANFLIDSESRLRSTIEGAPSEPGPE